jgi:hypothetical protein
LKLSLIRGVVGRHTSGRFSETFCPKDARTQTPWVFYLISTDVLAELVFEIRARGILKAKSEMGAWG